MLCMTERVEIVLTPEERVAAVAAIAAMQGGRYLTPEQINRAVEEERDGALEDCSG